MAGHLLKSTERKHVLAAVLAAIDRKFMGPDVDTGALRERHGGRVLRAESGEAFVYVR